MVHKSSFCTAKKVSPTEMSFVVSAWSSITSIRFHLIFNISYSCYCREWDKRNNSILAYSVCGWFVCAHLFTLCSLCSRCSMLFCLPVLLSHSIFDISYWFKWDRNTNQTVENVENYRCVHGAFDSFWHQHDQHFSSNAF